MSNDFELKNLKDKIVSLTQEQSQLTNDSVKAKRDEQMELDQIRRNFSILVTKLENRLAEVKRELANTKRSLESLEHKIEHEQTRAQEEEARRKMYDKNRN